MTEAKKLLKQKDASKQPKPMNTFAHHYIAKNLKNGMAISIPSLDITINNLHNANLKIRKTSTNIQSRNLTINSKRSTIMRILRSRKTRLFKAQIQQEKSPNN